VGLLPGGRSPNTVAAVLGRQPSAPADGPAAGPVRLEVPEVPERCVVAVKRRGRFLGGWLAAVALVLAGCGGGGSNTTGSSGPIKIGAVLPLTGEVAIDGQLESEGMKLAANRINAAGGVRGRKIQLLIEDGACDPAASAAAAQKLISRDGVIALSGAFCSSATAAIMPIAARFRVPFVSATSTAADLTEKGNQWFSRFAPTEQLMSRAAVPLLVQQEQIKRAYIIVVNDDYGISYRDANTANLRRAGVQIAGSGTFSGNTQDFAPLITRMEGSGADSVFVAGDTGPTANFFKQLSQLAGQDLVRVSAQVAASSQFVDAATPAAAEGIYTTTPYVPQSSAPRNAGFVKAYEARYGKQPESGAAGGYEAVYLFADALRRSDDAGGEALQKAIRSANLQTVRGQLTFDDKGQGYADFFLARIQGGTVAPIQQLSTTR